MLSVRNIEKGEINFDFQALIGAINNTSQALNYMKLKAGDKKILLALSLVFLCRNSQAVKNLTYFLRIKLIRRCE